MRNPAEESTEGKKCNISVTALLTGFPAMVGAMSYGSLRCWDMRKRMRLRQDDWGDAEVEDSKKILTDDGDVGVEW